VSGQVLLGQFYIILNLEVGRKPVSFPVSIGLGAAGGVESAYTYANSQIP
jgi:hypothetical protein